MRALVAYRTYSDFNVQVYYGLFCILLSTESYSIYQSLSTLFVLSFVQRNGWMSRCNDQKRHISAQMEGIG